MSQPTERASEPEKESIGERYRRAERERLKEEEQKQLDLPLPPARPNGG